MTEFIVHNEPVWRDRSNFVINAKLGPKDLPYRFEQLFARQTAEDEFEICCIPFFIFDLALGDIVKTRQEDGRKYVVDHVLTRSGRFVFRAWFGESFQPRREIADSLVDLGGTLEWSSSNLLAVDAVDEVRAKSIAAYLGAEQQLGHLLYETGRS